MKMRVVFLVLLFLSLGRIAVVCAQDEQDSLTAVFENLTRFNDGEKNTIFSSLGMQDASGFSWGKLIGCFVFSGVGLIAFSYGKKAGNFKPLLIGIILMVYSYFLISTFWLYAVGIGLCLLLYYWRD